MIHYAKLALKTFFPVFLPFSLIFLHNTNGRSVFRPAIFYLIFTLLSYLVDSFHEKYFCIIPIDYGTLQIFLSR